MSEKSAPLPQAPLSRWSDGTVVHIYGKILSTVVIATKSAGRTIYLSQIIKANKESGTFNYPEDGTMSLKHPDDNQLVLTATWTASTKVLSITLECLPDKPTTYHDFSTVQLC